VAAAQHPAVRAAYLAYEASREKLPQAGAPEDPRIEAGVFPRPMEFAGGGQVAQFRVMQMFPAPGVRGAARREAQRMERMAFESFRQTRNDLLMEVYRQWYALCLLRQRMLGAASDLRYIEQLERLALGRYTSAPGGSGAGESPPPAGGASPGGVASASASNPGMGGMTSSPSVAPAGGMTTEGMPAMEDAGSGLTEVMNLEIERMEVENEMENLKREMEAEKERFNALLNRPPGSDVVVPDTLLRVLFPWDRDAFREAARLANPMLGMLREESRVYEARAEMNRRMGYPMWGIGLQYMLMKPLATGGMSSSMNGRDMLMPMVSVTIPLAGNKYKAAHRESLLLGQAAEAKHTEALRRLEAELSRGFYLLDEAGNRCLLYERQTALILRMQSLAMEEFTSGRAGMHTLLRIGRRLVAFRLKEAEAIAAYNTGVAFLEQMITFPTIPYEP
jgi:outer membrane protein TolC